MKRLLVLCCALAFGLYELPVRAAPMYGSSLGASGSAADVGRKCLQNAMDAYYFPESYTGPLALTVFLDGNFIAVWDLLYGGTDSSTLTQAQAEAVLQDAMEVWNRESRGPVLNWGGSLNGIQPFVVVRPSDDSGVNYLGDTADDCEVLQGMPANSVLVYADGVDLDATSGLHARFFFGDPIDPIKACHLDEAGKVGERRGAVTVIFDSPAGGSNGIRTFHNLKALYVHEFGHALGLTHSNGGFDGGARGAISVMSENSTWTNFFEEDFPSDTGNADFRPVHPDSASPTGFYTQAAPYPEGLALSGGSLRQDERDNKLRLGRLNQIHLFPWDSDCVDDNASGTSSNYTDRRRRRLQYWSAEYNTQTNAFREVEIAGPSTRRTSKGFRSGGRLRSTSGAATYALFYDNLGDANGLARLVTPTALNLDGSIAYSQIAAVQGTDITHPQLPVVLFSPHEKTISSFNHVLWYARANRTDVSAHGDPNDDAALADAPVWRQQRGTSLGQMEAGQDLYFCLDDCDEPSCNDSCDERLLQTHIPPAMTWDPRSGQTLFAVVPTRGNCETDSATGLTCGRIYVHPGFATTGANVNSTLRRGTLMDARALGSVPGLPPYGGTGDYAYSGRTDVGVGLACAPAAAGSPGPCMLAWSDSGTPDGEILIAYFSASGSTVTFQANALAIGRYTRSDISAAYFDDRFWIAYKDLNGNPVYKSTALNDLDNWTGLGHTYTTHVAVEPPTWHYDPRNSSLETALVFAEYEAQNAGSTGSFLLEPTDGSRGANERLTYAFTWTVPEPRTWHDLATLDLRIRGDGETVMWVRFDEASSTFALYREASGKFGKGVPAGSSNKLQTPRATLHMRDTTLLGSGPTGPSVTVNLSLDLKPLAAGRTYVVEVAAEDDFGNADPFVEAGSLTAIR